MNGRIAHSLPPIAVPLAGGGPKSAPVQDQEKDEFASILQQLGSAGSGLAEELGRSDTGDSASAAEVFNAHGFFDRVEATIESKRAGRSAMAQPDVEPVARFAPASGNLEEIAAWRASITSGSIEQAMPQRQTKVVLPPFRPAGSNAPARPADLRDFDHGAATIPNNPQTDRPERAERTWPHNASQSKMAFKVLVDNGSIHIAGPVRDIAPEEEARLIEQVAELLIEHGLSLSDVRLNGRPLAFLRRNQR